ncbi:TetR/AcrR family transcriptional regulator [Mycobacterium sp. E2497]|uniref:TetR/AcrR family transcriptional regulator n=1 Tax=Mycobacterium sp. E2497 TaxID=1834135 RepID=UPI0008003609|nr:TetR/AcrR family transcriptional regulator [Mycobacterium sp. E2497]OBI21192.1 hypothetical protein A5713_12775 [Mycobacterium sp. E2497]
MTARPTKPRVPPWGADLPVDEDRARERLLAAADECYAEKGLARTRMGDIANKAGVHRSTVYYYFANKDALVAASFVRAVDVALEETQACWQTDEPFLDRLLAACLRGNEMVRNSPTMRAFMADAQSLGATFHAVDGAEIWRDKLTATLGARLARACADGEVRSDVDPAMMARWIVRVNFSLMSEPAKPADGGEEGILRHFLTASLKPHPRAD